MARPKVIALAPTALDRNGITTSVTPSAAATLDINGALATVAFDRNGVLTGAQYAAGTLDLVTNAGALGRFFSTGTHVVIWGASDESDKTFTITGLNAAGTAYITENLVGPNNANVYSVNVYSSVAKIVLDTTTTGSDVEVGVSGAAVFTQPQHITAYAPGDEATETFTITGTNRQGEVISDTITGVNASTVATSKNFATVTKVEIDGAATTVEVGVDGTCESAWFLLDGRSPSFNTGFGVDLSTGAVLTYDVEHTFSDVLASGFTETSAVVFNHDSVVGQTIAADGNYTNPPMAMRLAVTAHTSGSANLRIIQTGNG